MILMERVDTRGHAFLQEGADIILQDSNIFYALCETSIKVRGQSGSHREKEEVMVSVSCQLEI